MPIIQQKMIFREDVRSNPLALYVFGDNILRKGLGGQAKEMRHEANSVGVATKNAPGIGDQDFFSDEPAAILAQNAIIDQDMKKLFSHLKEGGVVIWPRDGIGTGLSRMPELAPTSFNHLQNKFAALCQVSELFRTGRYNACQRLAGENS